VVPRDAAALAWMANLACLELHPHPVRDDDVDHPDELRVDLDPVRASSGPRCVTSRGGAHALADVGLVGWPKTSGSRGVHIYVRIERRWPFADVRRAALALARDVERRVPALATSKWWKEERHGVFIDYNQNAKDRTIAAAYSVRPTADARVSAPLDWLEVSDCEPADFTLTTMPARFAAVGDLHRDMDRYADRSRRSSSSPPGTSATASAMRPGRPTIRSSRASRRESSRHVAGSHRNPLVEVARAQKKADALARWSAGRPGTRYVGHLEPADVLVDAMRGRFKTWTRIRVNLQHVPGDRRPAQEPLDLDDLVNEWPNVTEEEKEAWRRSHAHRRPSRARKEQ
jgi:DNA primase